MTINVRGRSSNRSRTSSGSSFKRGSRRISGKGTATVASGFKQCNNMFSDKINSFKTLVGQTKGPAKCSRPSPSTLNTFANWINKGAIIQTCSKAQVAKWAKTKNRTFNTRTATTGSCKTILCAKFGKPTIKAVARTKSGSFMVATTPKIQGKTFCFPK